MSNLIDRGYLGAAATLLAFGPLLKRRDQNPYATLIGLFLNATREVSTSIDTLNTMSSQMNRLRRYMPVAWEEVDLDSEMDAESKKWILGGGSGYWEQGVDPDVEG